jgi:hypothetical protein
MRLSVLVFASVFCVAGCREEIKNTCNVRNPRDLPWLRKIIDQNQSHREGAKIVGYTYRGESVFLVNLCEGCPDALTNVYNCKGEVICEFGGIDGRITCPDFSQAEEGDVIWRK